MKSTRTGQSSEADIVFCGTFATWRLGTLQSRALPLAQELVRQGVRCAIVTTPWDLPSEAGVVDSLTGVSLWNTQSAAPSVSGTIRGVLEQRRLVQALSPRAIHVFKPRGYGGFTGMGFRGQVPVLVDSDDWEGDGGWNRVGAYSLAQRRVFNWQEQTLLREADGVSAASSLLYHRARTIRRRTGYTDSSVLRLPNGLPRDWFDALAVGEPPDDHTRATIVIYSRFAEFSSDWLPKFLRALDRQSSTLVRVRLIGTDESHSGYTNVAVEPLGYLRREQLPSALAAAHLAVVPHDDSLVGRSKHSVKLLELMAAGCPIVTSDVGDAADITGAAAVRVASNNPELMAGVSLHLLLSPDRLRQLADEGRARVQSHYLIPDTARRLLRWYREMRVVE